VYPLINSRNIRRENTILPCIDAFLTFDTDSRGC